MRIAGLVCAGLVACASARHEAHAPAHAPDAELVVSIPVETTLDGAGAANASDVWLDMIRGAKRSIDIAEFYVSDQPSTRFHAVLDAIERAATSGVHVRLLVDEKFYAKYPEVPDAWKARPNMEVRRLGLQPGVLHAKYFVVDEREAYVGSQNFDWRSLDHIFEVGTRIRTPAIVGAIEHVFRADWDVAGGIAFHLDDVPTHDAVDGGDVFMGASPKKLVPESMWELSRLLAWIHDAKSTLRIELLTYKTKNRDGSEFHDLDDAIRDALKRGVHVQLLISTWGQSDEAVVSLAREPNVEVRVLVIPPFSGGDIPFARLAHAKYALFDEGRAWIGTSNWEGDYFLQSRNISLFFEHGGDLGGKLARLFVLAWRSPYAHPL